MKVLSCHLRLILLPVCITSVSLSCLKGPAYISEQDTELGRYLHRVAAGISSQATHPLRLYDTAELFSVALPDGSVAVSWGMLNVIANEAEFACMYAHEVAHHRLGHVDDAQDFGPSELVDPEKRRQLQLHEKNQDYEKAADRLAVDLCSRAGYDPLALPDLLYRVASYPNPPAREPISALARVNRVARGRIEAALAHFRTMGDLGRDVGATSYSDALKSYAGGGSVSNRETRQKRLVQARPAFYFDLPDERDLNCLNIVREVLNEEGIYRDMERMTTIWSREQCKNRETLPSNYYDAYGHCWIACQVTRDAGEMCAWGLGRLREEHRELEDWLDVDSHDSYTQDITNQEIGRALGADEDGTGLSCSRECSDGFSSLDLTAPQRTLLDCEKLLNERKWEARPDHFGMGAQCGEAASGEHEFRNPTGGMIVFKGTTSNSDQLFVTSPSEIVLQRGETVDIDVRRGCACGCGQGLSVTESMTIEYQECGLGGCDQRRESEYQEVTVQTSCRPKEEVCGGSGRDPHLWTFDGLRYDFQAVGEFLLARDEAGDVEIQVRQEPAGRSVSFNTAIAMKVRGSRVAFYSKASRGFRGLYIDGQKVDESRRRIDLAAGGRVEMDGSRASVVWPDGRRVVFPVDLRYLDVVVHWTDEPSQGLLGDADGDRTNDLRIGKSSQAIRARDFENLYGAFSSRWQVTQALTLFDYLPGESVETYRDPRFPAEMLTYSSLTVPQREFGELACRQEGVHPQWFQECVFDVGITGDRSYARGTPGELGVTASVEGPTRVAAGSTFQVTWRGPDHAADLVGIFEEGAPGKAPALSRRPTRFGSPLLLTAPDTPGRYALRYIQGRSRGTLAEAMIEVEPAPPELTVRPSGGSGLELGGRVAEIRGGEVATGEGIALVRTTTDRSTTLHAIDIETGEVRWSAPDIDPYCRPVVVERHGVAAQLRRGTNSAGNAVPVVLLSLDDGKELARSPGNIPGSGCQLSLSASGSTVVQPSRHALYAFDAANGMVSLWTAETREILYQWVPVLDGHLIVFARQLPATLRIRSLVPDTGNEVDDIQVAGGTNLNLSVLSDHSFAAIAGNAGDEPKATTVVEVVRGKLTETWSRDFAEETELRQPPQLALVGDVVVGWTRHASGNGLVGFDAETGDIVWTHRATSFDNSRGMVETVGESVVAITPFGGAWVELVSSSGETTDTLDPPTPEYRRAPDQLTALPDGRYIATGMIERRGGAYVLILGSRRDRAAR